MLVGQNQIDFGQIKFPKTDFLMDSSVRIDFHIFYFDTLMNMQK